MKGSQLTLLVLIGVTTWPYIWAYRDGFALESVCKTMEVNHGTAAQTSHPPFTIEPLSIDAVGGQEYEVSFTSTRPMRGIMMDARMSEEGNPDGNWTRHWNTQTTFGVVSCEGKEHVTLVHTNGAEEFTTFTQSWTAPSNGVFHIRAAVVENKATHWKRVPIPPPTTESPTTDSPTTSPVGSTSGVSTLATQQTTASNSPWTTPSILTTFSTASPGTTLLSTIATSKPSMKCLNGGKPQNGICICTDEWSGSDCSIGNFCNETMKKSFTFPKTVIGWSAYSKETCEKETNNYGTPRATARCLNSTGTPTFDEPQEIDCGITLDDLRKNLSDITAEQAVVLATSTQMLTSSPDQLTSASINSAAEIVNAILTTANISEEAATSAVTSVSQLLSADPKQYTEGIDSTTTSLAKSIENLAKSKEGPSQVVQPKLVVQTTNVQSQKSKGVRFRALTGLSDSFTANRIVVDTNASVRGGDEIPTDVDILIKFPEELSGINKDISVGFALYDNDVFFQSKRFKSSLGTNRKVISGSITGAKAENVDMSFRPSTVPNKVLHSYSCVFWNFTINDWDQAGCQRISKDLSRLGCRCNHTTNFAVLMSFKILPKAVEALNWISILGCTFSILGLSITLIYQILTRKARRNAPTALLVCLCTSMIIYNITFLAGSTNPNVNTTSSKTNPTSEFEMSDEYQDPDEGFCTLVTALLQYFLLATFSFNTLYAADLFMLLRRTLTQSRSSAHFRSIYMIVGWGFPAVMVAITLGVSYRPSTPLNYRRLEVCWLAATSTKENGTEVFDFKKPMLWGFLVPLSAMLLFNTFVFLYFAFLTLKQPLVKSSRNSALKKKLLSNFSLGVVLGLSWVLGYLLLASSYEETLYLVLNIVFCLLVSTQGIQIFILFTARSTLFRKNTSHAVRSISEISLHRSSYVIKRRDSQTKQEPTGESNDAYGIFTGRRSESSA